jgi:hypothetical protein
MTNTEQVIETPIDRLVGLVKARGRISVNELSKHLEVSNAVITEWAESLSGKELIGLEYGLFNTFVVLKQMTPRDVESKKKVFNGTRETIVRQAEGMLNYFDNEKQKYRALVSEFSSLKKVLGQDKSLKKELEHLERLELIKEGLNVQVSQSKKKLVVLKEVSDNFAQEVKAEKASIKKLIKESISQKKKIAVIEKSKTQLTKHLKVVDGKINAIDRFLSLDKKRNDLHNELTVLIKQAKKVELSTMNSVGVSLIQQKLKEIESEKDQLAKNYRKLEVIKEVSQTA